MQTKKLDYYLPEELIAQQPSDKREQSKMMVLDRSDKSISGHCFAEIKDFLKPGDVLVLNDTRVLPARFYGKRKSGAKLEGLFLNETLAGWDVMIKNSRKLKPSEEIIIFDTAGNDYCSVAITPHQQGRWLLKMTGDVESTLAQIGFAPLPPYIKRDASDERTEFDRQRYQTVYAKQAGAVAAPTAGLHFTPDLLNEIEAMGVKIAHVTLHVGAGTFKPVTAENLIDHEIHSERYEINPDNASIINSVKDNGGKVIAVGTTSVRTLETVACNGKVSPVHGETKLFITPGYEYKIVDAMITNFHLPKSTLLALVGAFAGLDFVMDAYKTAVEQKYRFYSYGDCMLII